MSVIIDVICPQCKASMELPYVLLGSSFSCCTCGKNVIPKVRQGAVLPNTGYELKFSDFLQLINYKPYRSTMADLLRKWCGYRITVKGDLPQILSSDGDNIPLVALHQRIQADPEKQLALYRSAMALWR